MQVIPLGFPENTDDELTFDGFYLYVHFTLHMRAKAQKDSA